MSLKSAGSIQSWVIFASIWVCCCSVWPSMSRFRVQLYEYLDYNSSYILADHLLDREFYARFWRLAFNLFMLLIYVTVIKTAFDIWIYMFRLTRQKQMHTFAGEIENEMKTCLPCQWYPDSCCIFGPNIALKWT